MSVEADSRITTSPAVRARDVSKTYGSGAARVAALRGVDLEIPTGQFVVVLGPSGSGKTTLLNVIGAIETPTSGRLMVGGQDLSAMSARQQSDYRRGHVGFVFQFFNLIPSLSALENVQLVAELLGEAPQDRGRQALESVGLADRMDHFPGGLSGGEQQRVAIARALANDPPLLLCDEPTGSLDLDTGRQVLALLHRLNRQDGRTVLLVTHNSAIARMADRIVRMGSGSVVDDRPVADPVPPQRVEW